MSTSLLAGTRAVVTGGGAIGSVIAATLVQHGASVIVWDVSDLSLDAARGAGCDGMVVDITDETAVAAAAATATKAMAVDMLVNTAAVAAFGPVVEMSAQRWARTLDVNITGTFLTCRALVPSMTAAGRGSIINISSIGGLRGEPDFADYCASKFAVIGFSQSLAREIGPSGIRVNVVCPGAVDSTMNTETMARDARRLGCAVAEIEQKVIEKTALRRLMQPSDIANAVVFLGSPLSSAITGETISVNGGVF